MYFLIINFAVNVNHLFNISNFSFKNLINVIGLRNCFEFLQEVLPDWMYPFLCALDDFFGPFRFCSSSDSPLSFSSQV